MHPDNVLFWINTYCLQGIIKNQIINKLIAIESLFYMRQVQFLSFIFQKPLFTNDQLILMTTLFIVANADKSFMMYCDVKINVLMMLFVTCCFADVIENMT